MPRPEVKLIKITVDDHEIECAEGTMLVDAAKQGDVEIPYFCYEPKLGAPVGACRMCLVEVEGIPKLQTACSTPVKDGMVVHTTTDRVKTAQTSVVEFLLVNHPLDCPVCDKGGECPLQDITFGWGKGLSRVVEPKRHFEKPLALSPLIAIDRERCILCYRCVRFSQEISEDWQLIFAERGAHTFVGTHDGHPYSAPFSGNIVELCPVGALTSRPYRFRARPWDIEGAGGVCTLCPAQCNVEFTVRDDKVSRVLARQHHGIDDGWLCDKGRFAYQAIHVDDRITSPLVRDGDGNLRPASWEDALSKAAELKQHAAAATALIGGGASNEEALLLGKLFRDGLGSNRIDARTSQRPLPLAQALADPKRAVAIEDIDYADTVVLVGCEPVDDAPILDLRIRKAVRRNGVKLGIVNERVSTLDPNAAEAVRSLDISDLRELQLSEESVVIWGERLSDEQAMNLLDTPAQLLEIPSFANGRGLREAGATREAGPGYRELEPAAPAWPTAFWCYEVDPYRQVADRAEAEAALSKAELVIATASVLTEGIKAHADVVFPAESSAEKEGTVTHPDGRVQRLRAAIGHPGEVRAGWQVIADVAKRVGHDLKVLTPGMAFKQLTAAVPFYAGLTLEQLGGRGVRWPEAEGAARFPSGGHSEAPAPAANGDAGAGAGTGTGEKLRDWQLEVRHYRSLWAAPEVEISPALHFARARQLVEMHPHEAHIRGIEHGDKIKVGEIEGELVVRTGTPRGLVFVADGLPENSGNQIGASIVEVEKA